MFYISLSEEDGTTSFYTFENLQEVYEFIQHFIRGRDIQDFQLIEGHEKLLDKSFLQQCFHMEDPVLITGQMYDASTETSVSVKIESFSNRKDSKVLMKKVARCTNLDTLLITTNKYYLGSILLSDLSYIAPLFILKKLRHLDFYLVHMEPKLLQRLRKKLPHCKIRVRI